MQETSLKKIAANEVQQFILENESIDEKELVLRSPGVAGIPTSVMAVQIAGRRKAKSKHPFLFNTQGIIYPAGINIEQSSSERSAQFKAQILRNHLGQGGLVLDLTGGMGVDAYFLSQIFDRVIYVEPDPTLFKITSHNHQILSVRNIDHVNSTAEDFLSSWNGAIDAVYIDPSRRDEQKRKVAGLRECVPDVITLQQRISSISRYLFIKTSPLLDIKMALSELQFVKEVTVVAVDNDCKEVLYLSDKMFAGEPVIKAVNLIKGKQEVLTFTLGAERNSIPQYSAPLAFIYEPNVAVLKAGAFKLLVEKFNVKKLDPNTHLYTSDQRIEGFPGRVFNLNAILSADAKVIHEAFPERKANIIVRNYPASVADLKKKFKISEGGTEYLMAATAMNKRILMWLTRLV